MADKKRVAAVTGSAGGIGAAIAQCLAADRMAVAVIDIKDGHDTVEAIRSTGGEAEFFACDLTDPQAVSQLGTAVEASLGGVDVLVNNAGIITYDLPHEVTLEDWSKVVAVNQTGTWLGMREVVPGMLARGGGSIINVSSIWGNAAVAGAHAYHATKGAVRNMSKSAAITYAKDGIRVNSLAPGYIETEMSEGLRSHPRWSEELIARTPLGRFATTAEIAACALFLASPIASYVTGTTLLADGGWSAR